MGQPISRWSDGLNVEFGDKNALNIPDKLLRHHTDNISVVDEPTTTL